MTQYHALELSKKISALLPEGTKIFAEKYTPYSAYEGFQIRIQYIDGSEAVYKDLQEADRFYTYLQSLDYYGWDLNYIRDRTNHVYDTQGEEVPVNPTTLVNLTTQDIVFIPVEGTPFVAYRSAKPFTLATHVEDYTVVSGVPVQRERYENIADIPAGKDGTLYIVDEFTYRHLPWRRDLAFPIKPITHEGITLAYRALEGHGSR